MATYGSSRACARFDWFQVDLSSGELFRSGVRVPIQEQPLQVLRLLLEADGQVVTREDLRAALWPKDTFVDFEHGVNTAVKKLRQALEDSAERPKFVETLPKFGYRLIIPVEWDGDARGRSSLPSTVPIAPPEPAPVPQPIPPERKGNVNARPTPSVAGRWRWKSMVAAGEREQGSPIRRWMLAVGMIVVAVGAVLVGLNVRLLHRRSSGSASVPRIQSLAVLPLENLSGDPSQDYFADGMTDALTTDLSKISALRVISRTSAMRYKGTNKTLPEIAKELNVDGIVEGSVMRSGNRVRISAQLIRATTDQHVWADSYEHDLGDVLKLQGEVAQAIAQQVRVQLTPQQQARLGSARAVNPEAYEAYLKGRFYATTGSSTLRETKNAQSYFEEAIQKDSGFALAYVGLAECDEKLGVFRWIAPQDAYRPAKAALYKALRLDETVAEAHAVLGWLGWRYDWDWPTAEREFNLALELNPNYGDGHAHLAVYLGWAGRRAEALAEVAKVRELNPDWTFNIESEIYYLQRDYKAMVEAGRQSVASNPGRWLRHYFLAVGYEGSGQRQEAIPEYQKAVELSQGDTDPTAGLAHAYAVSGQRASAEKILRELLQKSKTSYVSPYMIGTIYAGLGDKNKAFEFLEKAYQERSPDIPYFLKADLRIDNLRSDPRFQDLLRRVGLPQ